MNFIWDIIFDNFDSILLVLFITILVKVLNYSIFDYNENAIGKIGTIFMAIFTFYDKIEISKSKTEAEKNSKLINNICSYILLTYISIPTVLFAIELLSRMF